MNIVPFGIKIRKKRRSDTIDLNCRRDIIVLDQRVVHKKGISMKKNMTFLKKEILLLPQQEKEIVAKG